MSGVHTIIITMFKQNIVETGNGNSNSNVFILLSCDLEVVAVDFLFPVRYTPINSYLPKIPKWEQVSRSMFFIYLFFTFHICIP